MSALGEDSEPRRGTLVLFGGMIAVLQASDTEEAYCGASVANTILAFMVT
jgi:hypothetical protein